MSLPLRDESLKKASNVAGDISSMAAEKAAGTVRFIAAQL